MGWLYSERASAIAGVAKAYSEDAVKRAPGAIRRVEWKQIGTKLLKDRNVVLDTDSAKYRESFMIAWPIAANALRRTGNTHGCIRSTFPL